MIACLIRRSRAFGLSAVAGLAVTSATICQERADGKDAPKPEVKAVAPAAAPGVLPQTLKVNELVAKAWQANSIRPSARAGDHEFLRRVFLDLIGRIATPKEVGDFRERSQRRSAGEPRSEAAVRQELRGGVRPQLVEHLDGLAADPHRQRHLPRANAHLARRPFRQRPLAQGNGRQAPHRNRQNQRQSGGQLRSFAPRGGGPRERTGTRWQVRHGAGDLAHDPPVSRFADAMRAMPRLAFSTPIGNSRGFWSVNVYFRQVERIGQPNMIAMQRVAGAGIRDTDKG